MVKVSNENTRLLELFCWFYYNSDFGHIQHINLVSFFNFELVFLIMGKLRIATIVSLHK